jgi:hypothetical protein
VLAAAVHLDRNARAAGVAQRRLERFGQALLDIACTLSAIDYRVDVVLLGSDLELGQVVYVDHFAVDPKPHEALRLHGPTNRSECSPLRSRPAAPGS